MFGTLGGPELFLIFVVALIVFGPRKLPEIGKSLGKMMAEFRKASNEFRSTIESEVEAEKIRESMRIEPAEGRDGAAASAVSASRPTVTDRRRLPEAARHAGGPDATRRRRYRRRRPPRRRRSPAPLRHGRRASRCRRRSAASPIRRRSSRSSRGRPAHHGATPPRQDDVPRAPRGAAPAARARARSTCAGGFAVCWGFHEQIFHFLTRADAQGRLQGPVHLHEPGRGADALHEDGLLRGHLRGLPVRALGDLGLHLARPLQATRRAGRCPFIGMGSFFFILGALFGHYFLFPMHLRVPGQLRRAGHAVHAEDRRVLVLLLVVPARASGSCSRSRS